MKLRLYVLVALLLAVLASGCSDDHDNGNNTRQFSRLTGTFANGVESGTLELQVAASLRAATAPRVLGEAGASVEGTLTVAGGLQVSLSGTLSGGTLSVSGGGYTLSGTVAADRIQGPYDGPVGAGSFLLVGVGESDTVSIYCGEFSGDDTGAWNFLLIGSTVVGQAYSAVFNEYSTFEGSRSGTNLSVQTSLGSSATGVLSRNSASGTWQNTAEQLSGSWSGSVERCVPRS